MYDSGDLLLLIQLGMIPQFFLTYRKVYHLYNDRINQGRKKLEAIEDVCFTFGYKERQVYNIINLMNREQVMPG